MTEVFAIIRYHVTQGDADGDEIAAFGSLEEAQQALEAGRASGDYVDDGNFWSGATVYELARRTTAGYFALDGGAAGPNGLVAAPTIRCPALGATWSEDPARRHGWP